MQSQEQQPHSLSNRPLLDSSTTSSLPRPSDNLYGTDQMSSNTYYLETLRDSSSDKLSDVPSFSKKLTVNGGASNGATTFRRARAETFSFFPSKLLPEETSAAAPTPSTSSSIMASRHRSGSLSLPRTGISGAFGPSLFATSWQPSSTMNGLVSERPTPSEYASSAGGEDETTAVARTLDYLGLDDPVLENGRHFAQSAQYPQMSRGVVPNSLGSVYANRGRSYSVAVGENLSVSIPTPSTYRPRASSIAFLESTADSDIQALRRSLARGELELEMESPDSENRSDNDRHLSLGRSSPKDYVVYGMDRSFNDSPTRLHHEHAHPHQIPTRSLWIGNIDPTLSPSDLLTLFSPFGPIESLRILPDKECAFVNYVRVEDAIRARDEMQGGRVGNCIVRIGFGKAEAINDTQGMQPTKSLWIGNIPPTTDPAELEALFTAYGPIESARVLTHKNCGFVNFYRLEDAMEARKNMNGKEIGGSVVKIGYAKVPSKSGEGTATLAASALVGTSFMGTASPARDRSNSLSGGFNNFATATGLAATPTPQMLYSPSRAINGAREFGMTPPPPPFPVNLEANVPAISGAAQTGSTRHSIGGGYPEEQMMALALAGAANKELNGMETLDSLWNGQNPNETYASAIPPVPEPKPNRRVDQSRLREMRKRLEGHVTMKDVEAIFNEVVEETVDLCTDYIGNVVIQKIIEKSSDQHRLRLVEKVAPHMAAIGIHKNGTWVVQKMIDYAKTTSQIQLIVTALKPFTPPLLLDQFGNYVVQCCLRLGTHRNQFVFDATHAKCWEVGQGRFGARAMRACLESQYTTKRQQKFVAEAIVHNAIQLATNPNGAILITWLLDTSSLPGRYQALAPKLAPHVPTLCTHKLASATILKLVNQRVELEARDQIIKEIFFRDDSSLEQILADQIHGVSVIQKILASACVSPEEKIRLADRVRSVLSRMSEVRDNQMGYKRLLDELSVIPSSLGVGAGIGGGPAGLSLSMPPTGGNGFGDPSQEVVSPLAPQHPGISYSSAPAMTAAGMYGSNGGNMSNSPQQPVPGWYGAAGLAQLPTPSHSPQPGLYVPGGAGGHYGMNMTGYHGLPGSPYSSMPGLPPMSIPAGAYYTGGSYPPSPQHVAAFQQHQHHAMQAQAAINSHSVVANSGQQRRQSDGISPDSSSPNAVEPEQGDR